jgi:hypothetical protein
MRQVNGWGFKRIVSGNDHNSYYHELFVREIPQLCLKMKRIKKGEADKSKKDDGSEDNLGVDEVKDEHSRDDSEKETNEEKPLASGNGEFPSIVQSQTPTDNQPGSSAGSHGNNVSLQYMPSIVMGSPSALSGNDAALNFLKASGFPGFNQLQGLMTSQPTIMGNTNGQNFLQGLMMAGGGGNSLQNFNFNQPGMPVGSVPQGMSAHSLNIQSGMLNAPNLSTPTQAPQSVPVVQQTANSTGSNAVEQNFNVGAFSALSGVDSAALAKLQEALAAAGGPNGFLNPHGQSGVSGQFASNNGNNNSNANAFVNLLNSQFGGQNAALLAAQLQAATQPSPAATNSAVEENDDI